MRRLTIWYQEVGRYLRSNRMWILAALLIVAEILVYACLHAAPNRQYEQYVAETLPTYSSVFGFILLENLKSAVGLVLLGFVPFGFGILYGTFMTAYGLVATTKQMLPLVGVKRFLLGTLPHGILEIPAILFCVVLGVLLSKATTCMLLRRLKGVPKAHRYQRDLCLIGKSVGLILVPLFTVAAVVEVTISQYLV